MLKLLNKLGFYTEKQVQAFTKQAYMAGIQEAAYQLRVPCIIEYDQQDTHVHMDARLH